MATEVNFYHLTKSSLEDAMRLTSAPAKGELRPAPSLATLPGWVEKLMSVPTPDSMGARPRPTSVERVPMARARLRASQ